MSSKQQGHAVSNLSAETNLRTATEAELRDAQAPSPKSVEELSAIIDTLVDREHDYGTCVYAMSIAATAAFNYVAHKLGVTGFQAGCADLDILKRTRRMERFRIVDMSNLLYPQYRDKFDALGYKQLIAENADWLAEEARKRLLETDNKHAHPRVLAHWQRLAALSSSDTGAKQQ